MDRGIALVSERPSPRAFFGIVGLLFAAAGAATIIDCTSMSAMPEMPMPGGWTMSMTWMRMPGQSWLGAGASFLSMWLAMMVAMMLPSLTAVLWRHRQALARSGETRLGRLNVLLGLGYFFVWMAFGVAAYPLGAGLAAMTMQLPALARAVPIAIGGIVLAAGVLQFTAWKAHQLVWCRADCCGHRWPADFRGTWQYGLRLGLRCCYCCAGPTAILLVSGVMNLGAMAAVTAAVALERLAPGGERVARATGAILIGVGGFLIARAAALE